MSRFGGKVAAVGAAVMFGLATMGTALAADAGKPAAKAPAMAQPCSPKVTKQAVAKAPAMHKMSKHVVANAQVKAVQEALIKVGAKLKADGIMGKHTRAALRAYQKKSGLKVSGRLNKATLQKLGIKS